MKKILTMMLVLLVSSPVYAQINVIDVVDGDTLKLANGEELQLIGVKIPEDEKMEQEAQRFTDRCLISAKFMTRFEYDVERKDKYGKTLAYVFIPQWELSVIQYFVPGVEKSDMVENDKNELFLNATLIKAGYATPMTIPPNVKYADLFQKLYKEARWEGRGLWKEDTARNNIEIQSAHQVCNIDDDCTTVEIECNSVACECGGQPIHEKFLKKYTDKLKKCRDTFEAIYGFMGVCDMDCPQLSDKCLNGVCTVVDTQTGLPFRIDE